MARNRTIRDVATSEGLFGPMNSFTGPSRQRPTSAGGLVSAKDSKIVRVAYESGGDNLYDYAVPQQLADQVCPGKRVRAPFGKGDKQQVGFCVEMPTVSSVERVKTIAEVVDSAALIDQDRMELARWIFRYYCCSLGQVLSAMVPAAVKRKVGMVKRAYAKLKDPYSQGGGGQENVRLSQKGRAIIDLLRLHSESGCSEMPVDEITETLGCTRQPLNTLMRGGLVEIFGRSEMKQPHNTVTINHPYATDIALNEDQEKARAAICKLVDQDSFNAVLLRGVTASGKTEVYMRCIEKVMDSGRQALVLVPEISMTPQAVDRFRQRFERVAVLHSALSQAQRHYQWSLIAAGEAQVVVGARSAVFAPLSRLGLIVVDEEHEPSYKQETAPRYSGRDVAVKLAQLKGITIVLGSATPSLESIHNCRSKGHYHLLELPRRVRELPMPHVAVVDMRAERAERKGNYLLSRTLEGALRDCLAATRQAILLLNRRGHSSYVFCPSCQFVIKCPNCDVGLTYHKTRRQFDSAEKSWVMCHHCLHGSQLPKVCPLCSKKLLLLGPGTQRATEELAAKFPEARLCRVDSDSMKSGTYERVLADFGAGRIDVLLGTQMIGKGLDFPNVALVGVLNADTALSLPDFRSSERTFQLLAQVAGRCGRAGTDGQVVIQSYVPEEPAVQMACRHDTEGFIQHELALRRQCRMPPYRRLARIVLRDLKLQKVELAGCALRRRIDHLKDALPLQIDVRGPIPASIAYLENHHRQEILLTADHADEIQKLLAELRKGVFAELKVRTAVDVDPMNLL